MALAFSSRTIAVPAFSSVIYLRAVAMSHAVLTLEKHAHVASGWASGIISFMVGVRLAGDELFLRIEIGLVA